MTTPPIPPHWKPMVERGMLAWAKTNTPAETWLDLVFLLRIEMRPAEGEKRERSGNPLVIRCEGKDALRLWECMGEPEADLVIPWNKTGLRYIDRRYVESVSFDTVIPAPPEPLREDMKEDTKPDPMDAFGDVYASR